MDTSLVRQWNLVGIKLNTAGEVMVFEKLSDEPQGTSESISLPVNPLPGTEPEAVVDVIYVCRRERVKTRLEP